MKIPFSFSQLPKINQKSLFIEKCPFCYDIFEGCPYFLNKTLDKVYSAQLRSCNPTNKQTKNTNHSSPLQNIWFAETLACRNSSFNVCILE